MYGTPTPQSSTAPQYVADLHSSLCAAYEQVQERTGCKLDRQKELYDRTLAVPRGQSKKLHRPWTGPYRIVAKLSDAVYHIQHSQARRKRLVVHFDRLKPCPQGVRLPTVVEGQAMEGQAMEGQSRATTFPPVPPLGTSLELLDNSDPDPPDSVPLTAGPDRTASPMPTAQDWSAPDPPAHEPSTARYPRRECRAPERLYPTVSH